MNKWSRFKFTPNLPLGANGERVTGSKAHIELSKEAAKEGMRKLRRKAWYFSKMKTTYSLLQRVLR